MAITAWSLGRRLAPIMRILLVEDTVALRLLFSRILRAQGFEVCEAPDGLAALACLADFRPELILTDMTMPSLDGIGLIQRLREIPGLDGVPVVAMSAASTFEAERAARHAGAIDFLAKPFDFATLLVCLNGYVPIDGTQAPSQDADPDHLTPEADGR
jgi:two-component system, chemotaxis family, chemotaxis protein CheY